MDGTPFGRYRLIELIGRGGMGEVWRAHDTDTRRTIAIKVLPESYASIRMTLSDWGKPVTVTKPPGV